ncbi:MAG: DUF4249 domain-containing protein [Bacteroidota bacterium]
MNKIKQLFVPIIFSVFTVAYIGCDLEKEIEIDLPEVENQMVIECYLEPGKPYRVLLTESQPFLDPVEDPNTLPTISDAIVVISRNGVADTLTEGEFLDFVNFKVYNYGSSTLVSNDLLSEYRIEVTDQEGRFAFAETRILPIVPIDSIEVDFNETDTAANILTWFTDPPETNYYRRVLNLNTLTSEPEQAFSANDAVFNGDDVVFGTGFDYTFGDTLITTLFHIDEDYYFFLETVSAAEAANNNPFAQPSFILDNIEGGIGIFTGLSYDRDTVIITE